MKFDAIDVVECKMSETKNYKFESIKSDNNIAVCRLNVAHRIYSGKSHFSFILSFRVFAWLLMLLLLKSVVHIHTGLKLENRKMGHCWCITSALTITVTPTKASASKWQHIVDDKSEVKSELWKAKQRKSKSEKSVETEQIQIELFIGHLLSMSIFLSIFFLFLPSFDILHSIGFCIFMTRSFFQFFLYFFFWKTEKTTRNNSAFFSFTRATFTSTDVNELCLFSSLFFVRVLLFFMFFDQYNNLFRFHI